MQHNHTGKISHFVAFGGLESCSWWFKPNIHSLLAPFWVFTNSWGEIFGPLAAKFSSKGLFCMPKSILYFFLAYPDRPGSRLHLEVVEVSQSRHSGFQSVTTMTSNPVTEVHQSMEYSNTTENMGPWTDAERNCLLALWGRFHWKDMFTKSSTGLNRQPGDMTMVSFSTSHKANRKVINTFKLLQIVTKNPFKDLIRLRSEQSSPAPLELCLSSAWCRAGRVQ